MSKERTIVKALVLTLVFGWMGHFVGCTDSGPKAPTPPPQAPLTKDADGKDLPKGVMPAESPF
jgi:hypothetical protein